MPKKIQYAIAHLDGGLKQRIHCTDLDKVDYNTKYKGKLTCIKGCDARIKFTERKNNIKFFSTWNKEGNLHKEGCPYHVDYKGKVGRKKLEAYYESVELDEETILNRLKHKMDRIINPGIGGPIIDPPNGTSDVEFSGKMAVPVSEDGDGKSGHERGYNIHYEEAEYISVDDIGSRQSVYGKIESVWLEEDKYKRKYAYFNLVTKYSTVHFVFQEAFYSNEFSAGIEEFEHYILKVKELVESNPENIWVMGYGMITRKKRDKNGVNVLIISPNRILVNNMTYKQILYGTTR